MLLIVEDDKTISEFIAMISEKYFEKVHCVFFLDEAFEALKNDEFSFVILDIGLNGENGGEVIKWMKDPENSIYNNVPILVTSGYFTEEFVANNKGRLSMLAKPFSLSEFQEKIEEMLDKQKNQQPKKMKQQKVSEASKNAKVSDLVKKLIK